MVNSLSRVSNALAGLVLLIIFVLAACSGPGAGSSPTPITVQLNAPHTAEFAGLYVAAENGYYTEENLSVEIKALSVNTNPTAELLAGNAQFGINSGDLIVRAQAAGNDIIAIASIYQINPLIIMSVAGNQIRSPKDLIGKTIRVNSADLDDSRDLQLLELLNRQDIDITEITPVAIQANELASVSAAAVSGCSAMNEAIEARLYGVEITQIFFSEYGILIYPNSIFTTGQMVREQPELVQAFIRATIRGWQTAIENPREAAEITLIYDQTLESNKQISMARNQIPLIDPGPNPIGWMDSSVWQITQEILLEHEIISSPLDETQIFTNRFVENAQ